MAKVTINKIDVTKSECSKCEHCAICAIKAAFAEVTVDESKFIDISEHVDVAIKCKHYAEVKHMYKAPDMTKLNRDYDPCPCVSCSKFSLTSACSCTLYQDWLARNNKLIGGTNIEDPCLSCEWNGKPFWSVVSPCEGCTRKKNGYNYKVVYINQDGTITPNKLTDINDTITTTTYTTKSVSDAAATWSDTAKEEE